MGREGGEGCHLLEDSQQAGHQAGARLLNRHWGLGEGVGAEGAVWGEKGERGATCLLRTRSRPGVRLVPVF